MFNALIKAIFGTKSQRDVKKMLPLVKRINELEIEYQKLSDEELQAKTPEFKNRLAAGETLDDIMCEAFATVKNACRRMVGKSFEVCGQMQTWDMAPFDVQLMGGIALHRGSIAEMATGEGKTLVATMPLYLNALTGKNCQLVTVNDYLALRDSSWMGVIYNFLGLSVGCLQNMQPPDVRKAQYACDITYGTNSEFGFDYLRDMGMASEAEQIVQRDHFYAIVDEIDSILIDEARTPLIISGPVPMATNQFAELKPLVASLYNKQNLLCSRLVREARTVLDDQTASDDARNEAYLKLLQVKYGMPTHRQLLHTLENGDILREIDRLDSRVHSDNNRGMLQEVQAVLYFTIDEKTHEADLTELGRKTISPDDPEAFIMQDLLGGLHKIETDETLSAEEKVAAKNSFQDEFSVQSERLHDLSQLLKAYCLFEKDVNYVVMDRKVMIVDEHTGRLMPGRRFSDGLHQALEAKEDVPIEQETQTMATITIQNYFRLYKKLAGMTGTAETEASEFHQIYKLDVVVIPTNRPCIRKDDNDSIFKTKREKFNAILDDVAERHAKGQPVLLGTISVDDSEKLSRMLKIRNIPHNVLNAKNHQHEAEIVARAGQVGAVTVATNMAGRGTDIKLSADVHALGGLHVIGSSRHDSRRIDRQLRGRCSRQGDPGSSKFYVSLEDELMRLFGGDRIVKIFDRFGLKEGDELQHPWLDRSIETAQKRVEQQHFAIRKRTLDFDDVMNKQREIIYALRRDALLSEEPHEVLFGIIDQVVEECVMKVASRNDKKDGGFDTDMLAAELNALFPLEFNAEFFTAGIVNGKLTDQNALSLQIIDRIENAYQDRNAGLDPEQLSYLQRHTILEAIDRLWQEHLYSMDQLRSSMSLRVYAQKDPLVEYKNEAFTIFKNMMDQVYIDVAKNLLRLTITRIESLEELLASMPQEMVHSTLEQLGERGFAPEVPEPEQPEPEVHFTFHREAPKVGRNDLCPCGSGKKYKKCCGKDQ
ncbi:MAG: preprotein translocase subunit SecA [Lentisphaeria bacterium]|nr:preprotein translocase subunit SecA [Lentisphaeria bacterium]